MMSFFQSRKQRPPPSEDSYSERVRRLFVGTSSVQRVSSINKDHRPRLGLQVLHGTPQVEQSASLQNTSSPAPTLFPPAVLAQPQLPSHALSHPLSRYLSEQVLLHNARDAGRTVSVYNDQHHVPGYGVDPEEQQLGELVHLRRQQRRRRHRHHQRHKGGRRSIFSRLNEQTVKSKLIGCVLSGLVLFIVLSIYLSLALSSRRPPGQEFHVIFILIILLITILFCHSLVRLCMIVLLTTPPARPKRNHLGVAARHSSGMDLRVIDLERGQPVATHGQGVNVDAEMVDAMPLEPPPPAYGLWRGSIRIDPNTLAPPAAPPLPPVTIPTRSHSFHHHHTQQEQQEHHPQSYRSRSHRTLSRAGPPIPPRRASSLQNGPPTPRNYSVPVPPLPLAAGVGGEVASFVPPPPPSTVIRAEMASLGGRAASMAGTEAAEARNDRGSGNLGRPPSYTSDGDQPPTTNFREDMTVISGSRYSMHSTWLDLGRGGVDAAAEQDRLDLDLDMYPHFDLDLERIQEHEERMRREAEAEAEEEEEHRMRETEEEWVPYTTTYTVSSYPQSPREEGFLAI